MKVCVVTGGSSGIGLAIAKKFDQIGYVSYSLDLKPPLEDSNIKFLKCNVANEGEVKESFERIINESNSLDVLINNCGFQYLSPIEDFPVDKWRQMIDVMLTGTFLCSQNVIPVMKKNKTGRIINISSVHGKLASPYKSAYVAAKHGVQGLSKVISKEVGPFGITVNCICPGFVDTPLMRNQVKQQMELNNLSEQEVLDKIFLKDQDIKSLTSPEQVAELCSFLSSSAASTITGEAYSISGGWGA